MMAKQFDLRKQLKMHDKILLQRLFVEQGEMACIDWQTLKPHAIDSIAKAWETMPTHRRQHYQVILLDVNQLGDSRGIKILAEELGALSPDKLTAFYACKSPADKALWTYLESQEIFESAAIFAKTDALRGGQYSNRWNGLPKKAIKITTDIKVSLQNAMQQFYWNKEMRGKVCQVHHYTRLGDAEFFFAYLPDWPDKLMVFDSDNNLTTQEGNCAFQIVFIYLPNEGAIEMIAKGGKKVQKELRKIFCKAVLEIDVDDAEPDKATYKLDHLLDSDFQFTTDPGDGIGAVHFSGIRLTPKVPLDAIEHVKLKFTPNPSRSMILSEIAANLTAHQLDRSQVTVSQVSIQLQFMDDGRSKPKTMTFDISHPNSCDLKSKPDDVRVIGERCVSRWGIHCE